MKVRIKQSSDSRLWYSECIGQVFWAFQLAGRLEVWFSPQLYFMPQDVEIIDEPCNAWIPNFTVENV